MDSACIRCGSTTQLATRPMVTWRGDGGEPDVRLVEVATCEPCRTRLRRLRDRRNNAIIPTPEGQRRFRAWDVTGALLVLSAAYAIPAAAGWVGTWSWWLAAALAVVALPASLLARRLMDAREETIAERFHRTDDGRAYQEEERRMGEAWHRQAARIETETGFRTEHPSAEGTLFSVDERALVDPDRWTRSRDGAVVYYLQRGDDGLDRRELSAAEAARAVPADGAEGGEAEPPS